MGFIKILVSNYLSVISYQISGVNSQQLVVSYQLSALPPLVRKLGSSTEAKDLRPFGGR